MEYTRCGEQREYCICFDETVITDMSIREIAAGLTSDTEIVTFADRIFKIQFHNNGINESCRGILLRL